MSDKKSFENLVKDATSSTGAILFKTGKTGQTFKVKAESVTQVSASACVNVTAGLNVAVNVGVTIACSVGGFLDVKGSIYFSENYASHLSVHGVKYMKKNTALKNSVGKVSLAVNTVSTRCKAMEQFQHGLVAANQFKEHYDQLVTTVNNRLDTSLEAVATDTQALSIMKGKFTQMGVSLTETMNAMNTAIARFNGIFSKSSEKIEVSTHNAASIQNGGGTQNIQGGVVATL